MIILTTGDGRRNEDSGGVDGLEDSFEMRSAGDFFDEERGESL